MTQKRSCETLKRCCCRRCFWETLSFHNDFSLDIIGWKFCRKNATKKLTRNFIVVNMSINIIPEKNLFSLRPRGFASIRQVATRPIEGRSSKVQKSIRKYDMESFRRLWTFRFFFLVNWNIKLWNESWNPFSSRVCRGKIDQKEEERGKVVIAKHSALNFYKHFLRLHFYDRWEFFIFSSLKFFVAWSSLKKMCFPFALANRRRRRWGGRKKSVKCEFIIRKSLIQFILMDQFWWRYFVVKAAEEKKHLNDDNLALWHTFSAGSFSFALNRSFDIK